MELLDEAKDKTIFILEDYFYQYTKCPMGLSVSGEATEDLVGLLKLVNDILIECDTANQLYKRIRKMSKRCREFCITVSAKI